MSEPSGAFEVTWKEGNMIAAYRLHCSRMWRWKSYAAFGAIFAVIFFAIFAGKSERLDTGALVASGILSLGIGIAIAGLIALANRYGSGPQARAWAKQFDLDGSVSRFEYDGNGLRIIDRIFGGEMRWSEAKGFVENGEMMLIYRSPQFYYYVSKRDVPEADLAKLRMVMQAAGLNEPGPSRPT